MSQVRLAQWSHHVAFESFCLWHDQCDAASANVKKSNPMQIRAVMFARQPRRVLPIPNAISHLSARAPACGDRWDADVRFGPELLKIDARRKFHLDAMYVRPTTTYAGQGSSRQDRPAGRRADRSTFDSDVSRSGYAVEATTVRSLRSARYVSRVSGIDPAHTELSISPTHSILEPVELNVARMWQWGPASRRRKVSRTFLLGRGFVLIVTTLQGGLL